MDPALELLPHGTVTTPRGFGAGAVACGIKTMPGALDLGLLVAEVPCAAAGMFTSNRVKAAPVLLCRERLQGGRAQGVVVNSGCANASTGRQGHRDAAAMAELAAQVLGLHPADILVASTGVIGQHLPLDKIRAALPHLVLSPEGGHALAQAIMTTDTRPKEAALRYQAGGGVITLGGIAKGAGMIHPNLATMLCFLTTDASVAPALLGEALQEAVAASFNLITVDGDTSPNDTILLLANSQAQAEPVAPGTERLQRFKGALSAVCTELAKAIARDGEGATKLIEVTVQGARSLAEARAAARTVAGSNLVKAAVHGNDPNWGRILAAAGRSGAALEEAKVDISLENLCLFRSGEPQAFDFDQAAQLLAQGEVRLGIDLHLGPFQATAWGCDLSQEYVTLNSAYTT